MPGDPLNFRCPFKELDVTQLYWRYNGAELNDTEKIVETHQNDSILKISHFYPIHAGSYECSAKLKSGTVWGRLKIEVKEAPLVELPDEELCGPEYSNYCKNGGTCFVDKKLKILLCKCPKQYMGPKCDYTENFVDKARFSTEAKSMDAVTSHKKIIIDYYLNTGRNAKKTAYIRKACVEFAKKNQCKIDQIMVSRTVQTNHYQRAKCSSASPTDEKTYFRAPSGKLPDSLVTPKILKRNHECSKFPIYEENIENLAPLIAIFYVFRMDDNYVYNVVFFDSNNRAYFALFVFAAVSAMGGLLEGGIYFFSQIVNLELFTKKSSAKRSYLPLLVLNRKTITVFLINFFVRYSRIL
uniref:EGF-like domain-containing protein n=1 Tax=Romanomermis culicivorax TaxID=13658 RepID=A0A915KWD5_ROMCU